MQDKEVKGKVNIGLRIVATADGVKLADTPKISSDDIAELKIVETEDADDADSPEESYGFKHNPDHPTDLSWSRYCAWRATKCPDKVFRPQLDELNQATLEFIGELGELSNIVGMSGLEILANKSITDKVVDEAGDVYFTGTWALDSWGLNYLSKEFAEENGVGILDEADLAHERILFLGCKKSFDAYALDPSWEPTADAIEFARAFDQYGRAVCLESISSAAMTANSLKKLMFQKRDQDLVKQCQSIMISLSCVERLLAMVGKTVNDALKANIEKLDARFPNGYQQGGGIRQGKGK